jgi:F0F1-type ATP synthase membrane subunit c/vacuolar-type H+-ATPase subunit K
VGVWCGLVVVGYLSSGVGVGPAGAAGVRPYVENCTVDASIFVAKLVRAHGGCLGTRSR